MTQQGDKGRVLIVEDSPVIAVDAEQRLQDDGWFVVGPAYDMDQAIDLAKREQFDAAVLDLNIRGEKSFAVMQILHERNIPFLITSGYADWSMPEEWRDRPRLQKPYKLGSLVGAVCELAGADQPSDG
ncbi:response regulator [Sphingomicrobium clamense]|uniref:Response regulator n=1 Tax=Sphingomicrobium clamense TaxID=2851013 RepID=A0ABS6V7B9_9SPHN|nr:response regulator [Sphingomicrobium sp. B8]